MKRIVQFSSNTSEYCRCLFYYSAMYMIQNLFSILQNEYVHYIDILHSWMLHSCRCNKTCIKFRDRFWFAIWGAFCRHEQRIKMMQMLPLHLKVPVKLIETLTRLSYCIVVLVDSQSFQTISVKIAWSFELFVVLHQVNPHWHRCQHPAFIWAESSQRCRL